MKHYVYALLSKTNGSLYIGMTTNVHRRLQQHNIGKTRSTKKFTPYTIIYTEEWPDRISAREREKYLKSGIGREFIKTIIS
ncbi:MAG: Excinuclease ABC C subunit domain protein [Parcubacteria group bacterium GW2011_GWD2_43_10]|uniref:Endonuclease n=2 Tax=Candidatus Vebleniibacteriota TaxID=1817921 RepID=A0A1G2Q3P7_9BACT|nr:MAG: Excinuclease ABC C subunit domain protein [Parcubacteria group bacterium GW2011_GWD2_43_10]KKS93175.1 MAG: Excinuclease ABC C subunit domain protein [Parcubacteria group bacterium GW2011_GWE2_43_12]OHA55203.1 MAG: endonuclease [Candidatus Veblenbacteria bacterium RIFOXYB1_FULL_43_13]OHA57395.1 MAG: endonuclease [Candidatus Veblenbacteria bacterium RIFOXYC2_FULL_42_11]HAO81585.1 endonuclease [Candidatus Veblenbacteria bacterium]